MGRPKGSKNKSRKAYTCGIYQIRNTENGKRYIGSSQEIEKRWGRHQSMLRKGIHHKSPRTGKVSHLQHAWNKYGADAFVFEVLEECPKDKLIERETYWFQQVAATQRYNGTDVGPTTRGYKHTQKTRQLMSEKASVPKPHKRKPVQQLNRKRQVVATFDSCREAATSHPSFKEEKIAACCRGDRLSHQGWHWQFVDDPVEIRNPNSKFRTKYQFDSKGTLLHTYRNTEELRAAGFVPEQVTACCRGTRKTHQDFYWSESHTITIKPRRTKFRPRSQYDLAGNFLKVYKSIEEIRQDGFSPDGITRCCRGDRPTYKGYIWT